MNTFHNLLARYAADSGLSVDAREWLMLLELDPVRAATAMTQLTILAAEDHALRLATEALDVLQAAARRADATASGGYAAAAQIAAFTERMTTARARAWQCWRTTIVPLLRDAGVLHDKPGRAITTPPPPRSWTSGRVSLPGHPDSYPAQIASRRRIAGRPVVRVDADTCQRLATDLTDSGCPVPPLILIDRDRPIAVLGAADLEHAWRADAALVHADTDGYFTLGHAFPWQTNAAPTSGYHVAAYRHRIAPARPGTRHTARPAHLRLLTSQ